MSELFDITKDSEGDYHIVTRIGNQTLDMSFVMYDWTFDSVYFNVVLEVYNKRKAKNDNMNSCKLTGQNPLATALIARKAFKQLEQYVLAEYNTDYNVAVHVCWTNSLRRDVYQKVLTSYGYTFGFFRGQRILQKVWKKGDICAN